MVVVVHSGSWQVSGRAMPMGVEEDMGWRRAKVWAVGQVEEKAT